MICGHLRQAMKNGPTVNPFLLNDIRIVKDQALQGVTSIFEAKTDKVNTAL